MPSELCRSWNMEVCPLTNIELGRDKISCHCISSVVSEESAIMSRQWFSLHDELFGLFPEHGTATIRGFYCFIVKKLLCQGHSFKSFIWTAIFRRFLHLACTYQVNPQMSKNGRYGIHWKLERQLEAMTKRPLPVWPTGQQCAGNDFKSCSLYIPLCR